MKGFPFINPDTLQGGRVKPWQHSTKFQQNSFSQPTQNSSFRATIWTSSTKLAR